MMAVAALSSARAKKFFVFREGKVAGFRVFGGGETVQNGVAVADDFALEMFCDFRGSGHFAAAHYKRRRILFNPYFAPSFCRQPKSFLALMTSKMAGGMSWLKASSPEWILARTSPE